jgi:thiamine-monophosphate kinase
MIDLSDGIASDARRIAAASGVGVIFQSIPVADGATENEALCGGDDYELLFCVPNADLAVRAFEAAGLRTPMVVGICTSNPSELRFGYRPLPDCGWEHDWLTPENSSSPTGA